MARSGGEGVGVGGLRFLETNLHSITRGKDSIVRDIRVVMDIRVVRGIRVVRDIRVLRGIRVVRDIRAVRGRGRRGGRVALS